MTSAAVRLTLALAAAAQLGCSSDHDLLAQKPTPPGPDGATDGAGDGSFPVGPRDARTPMDAIDPEPPGPWVLTLVNGVVDVAGPVRFCFVPVVDGGEAPGDDPPFPASGLSFGSHVVLAHLPQDPRTTDLHPYLVVGAEGANAGTSCKQVLRPETADGGSEAGPPAVSAYSLGLLPAGTLGESRSYLAIANGCSLPAPWPVPPPLPDAADAGAGDGEAGDAGDLDSGPTTAGCGTGTAGGPTTLGLTLVRLSRRIDYARVGFQTVNGSNAAGPAMLLMENWTTNVTIFASDPLDLGQISPHAQPGYVDKGDFGLPIGTAPLSVVPPAGTSAFAEFDTNLAAVLAQDQLTEGDLTEGALFTFVLLGAEPRQTTDPRAAGFRIGLVRSAPDVGDD
jgi:hypothetical protein